MSDNPPEGDLVKISSMHVVGPNYIYVGNVYYQREMVRMRNVVKYKDGIIDEEGATDIYVGLHNFSERDNMINLSEMFRQQFTELDGI